MEEKVIVFKYNKKDEISNQDLFLTIPRENEISFGHQTDQNIFILNGTDMVKATDFLHSIAADFSQNILHATQSAKDLYNEGLVAVEMKKNVVSKTIILS